MSVTPTSTPRKSQTATPVDFEKRKTKSSASKSSGIPRPDASDLSATRSPRELTSPQRGYVSPRKIQRQRDAAEKRSVVAAMTDSAKHLWTWNVSMVSSLRSRISLKKVGIAIAMILFLLCLLYILDDPDMPRPEQ